MDLAEALANIQRDYTCKICDEIMDTHSDAVRHMIDNHIDEQNFTH